jgi:hypothetical protein
MIRKAFGLAMASLLFLSCGGGLDTGAGDSSGNSTSLWTGIRELGDAGTDLTAMGMAVASNGRVYAGGYTTGAFDGHAAVGSEALFLVGFDSVGNKLWSVLHGVAGSKVDGRALAATSAGNVVVAGLTDASTLDGQARTGAQDLMLTSYDSSGNLLWTRLRGGPALNARLEAVASDGADAIYAVGNANGSLDSQMVVGSQNATLVKYDLSGNWAWTRQIDTNSATVSGTAVAVSSTRDTVYIGGQTDHAFSGQTQSGSQDAMLAKYSSSGTFNSVVQIGGGASTTTNATGVAIDSAGRIYLCGYTTGSLTGNTKTGTFDAFIAQYEPDGVTLNWVRQYGVSGTSTNGGRCIVDGSDHVYALGNTRGAWDGSATPVAQSLMLSRFDSSGNRLWTKLISSDTGVIEDIALANYDSSSVLTYGRTKGGVGGNTLIGTRDLFLGRFDSSGTLQ